MVHTFRIFEATEVHRLHVVDEGGYFRARFSLFGLGHLVRLARTDRADHGAGHGLVIARAIRIRRSRAFLGALANLL